jgi:prepilin-type N-terminal cleavage/methylation domain-containing protein
MKQRQAAFTLIELLVVISIISMLVAILLPALTGARKSAWLVNCMSNQRQVGMYMHVYAQDYKGYPFYFVSTATSSQGYTMTSITGLGSILIHNEKPMDTQNKVMFCPSQVGPDYMIGNNSFRSSFELHKFIYRKGETLSKRFPGPWADLSRSYRIDDIAAYPIMSDSFQFANSISHDDKGINYIRGDNSAAHHKFPNGRVVPGNVDQLSFYVRDNITNVP